jgi:nicotinate-nucleotide pyrophosphorylase (carboxylating)
MQRPFDIEAFLFAALAEDVGEGDLTSNSVIPADTQARLVMRAREMLVVAGATFLPELFHLVDPHVKVAMIAEDGQRIKPGDVIAILEGPARALLTGERTALNLVQQLSGVATLTRQYVDAIEGTGTKLLDTRKTIPGLRYLQKYAVRCGGGQNHRMGLYDAIMIKDNHIAIAGSLTKAVQAARENAPPNTTVEVECDTLKQVREAIDARADILLLDNMDNATLFAAVALAKPAIQTEASGNVSLETIRAIAQTGVDFISVGKLTHSARAVDIGLDDN